MIKLGVTSCFLYPDQDRPYFAPKTLCYLENDMAKYLTRKGVLPVLIPDLSGEQMSFFLEDLDGLVLQGGSDVCPESYKEDYLDKSKWPGDKYRDDYELMVMDYFYKKNKPIYGICRGAQVVNTYFGGTLYQDLPGQLKSPTVHRDGGEYDKVKHSVEFISGGVLDKIYSGKDNRIVNSVHHQAVKTLGKGLTLEAKCPDDEIVEGFSQIDDKNFVLAVQWHPEFSPTLGSEVLDPDPLFDFFLERIKTCKS